MKKYERRKNLKVAYIGGGSLGLHRNLMNDLVKQSDEIIKEGNFSFYGSGEETKRLLAAQ